MIDTKSLNNIVRAFTLNIQQTPTGLTKVGKEMRASGYSNEPTFIFAGKDKDGQDVVLKITPKTKEEADQLFNVAQQKGANTYGVDTESGGHQYSISDKNQIYSRLSNKGSANVIDSSSPGSQISSPAAQSLVNQALLQGDLTNLSSKSFWNSQPQDVRTEAFQLLQDTVNDPQKLAQFVQSNGLTNLQQYSWWNNSPIKQDAWNLISSGNTGTTNTDMGTSVGTQNTGTTTTGGTTTGGELSNNSVDAALKNLESNAVFQSLPDSLKSLYRQTVQNWDFNKELNVDSIMQEFNKIKTQTIDPRFAQYVSKFTGDLQKEYNALGISRANEQEAEKLQAGQNIMQAKSGLEAKGLTFSGEGVKALGAESAFSQNPTDNMPSQTPLSTTENVTQNAGLTTYTPFGGDKRFWEGSVNQSNRLMASSASNRYKQSINALGQQAENALGGAAVPGLVPGYSPSGTLPGSYADTKQSQYGQTLSQLMGQKYQNLNNNKNLNYNL